MDLAFFRMAATAAAAMNSRYTGAHTEGFHQDEKDCEPWAIHPN